VKIYTRTGDTGETGLFDGTRVLKNDVRVAAYGDVDELNAWVGFARASVEDAEIRPMLERIQRDLFAIGARLADPAHRIAGRVAKAAAVNDEDISRLEQWIDALERDLPPLRRFILSGGSPAGAALHVARTVCRRAERAMVTLERAHGAEAFESPLLVYVNRLSDLLFTMARAVNHRSGATELEW
jgi:cob(I)alamin adenosyltransferase